MRDKPLVIGLTGSIGCGKSAVMQTLIGLGAEGIDADKVAHKVMAPDGPAYPALVAEFGQGILTPDGQVDRGQVARQVFADPEALARLERIVHPAVGAAVREQVAASTAPAVAIEAIKLLEAGLSRMLCDEVWVVTCSREQQLERLAESRGMTAAEVDRRLAAQMPQSQMIAQASRVIETSGTRAASAAQVLGAWVEHGLPLQPAIVRAGTLSDAEGIAEVLNAVVREGGVTVLDRCFSAEEEKAFLAALPARARVTVALLGTVVAGFQVIEPYASHTGAMDHVGSLGTYVLRPARGHGVGRALAQATFSYAREAGFGKLVAYVRADNQGAQEYYLSLGFKPCGRLTRQAFVDGGYLDELLYEYFL